MSRREPPPLVALGGVARPHGVRGEVRVHPFNPDSELLLGRETVWLRRADDEPPRQVRVLSSRRHGAMVLLCLEGVQGRAAADALRGLEVCVPRTELPPPEEDEVYHVDLIDAAVVDPAGRALGTVSNVIRYPSVDCLVVQSEEGVREVPLLEPYVVDVDLDAGAVTVDHIEDFDLQRRRGKR